MTAIGVKLGPCGEGDCALVTVYKGRSVIHPVEGPAWSWLEKHCPVLPTTFRRDYDLNDQSVFKTAVMFHELQMLQDTLKEEGHCVD